jgi:hypothetical protein
MPLLRSIECAAPSLDTAGPGTTVELRKLNENSYHYSYTYNIINYL